MSNPIINLKSIFAHAVELDSAEARSAYLAQACGDNAVLRAEIDGLLIALDQAGAFMQSPAAAGGDAFANKTVEHQPVRECAGTVIGPYKLLEQIGEGGMGVVYMADQQAPLRRRVALKIIKPGMDTRQVIARFEAERQALALMDHPNIARVLDAGATDSGRPYFVMELVRGIAITDYCDQNNLPVHERLDLFVLVCQAVQHAHQKGIIHRDLKPSNILVTLHDGSPVPKVIDFGVAKATNQQLTESTLFTNFAQMVGTPLYMSPEQAEMTSLDIDTRSDVYSLGVLLYELLTGTTPFDKNRIREAAYEEVRRIIREEEPQKPSTRLSSLGATRTAVAAHRKADPQRLSQMLCGDLDWIVMKSLEKDRTRRYETANGMARDVQRYLSDQPVEACPPSASYRFRKFARRNRVALTTASVVLVALAAGTVISTWQAIRATRAETLAQSRLDSESRARAAEAQQRKVAEDERTKAEKQRERAEANFQYARKTVDEYFTLVSENKLLDVPGLQPLRKELLAAALEFYKKTAVERTSDPAVLADVAVSYLRVALVEHSLGRNDDSIVAIVSGLDVVDRLRRDYPSATEHHRRVAGFWKGYRPNQIVSDMPKNPLAAFQTLQRAIKCWQELVEQDPDHHAFQSDLASLCYMTGLLMGSVNEGQSLRYLERAKVLLEKLIVSQPDAIEHRADLARVSQDMVGKLSRAGRKAEAVAAQSHSVSLREDLVAQFPDSPRLRAELAVVLCQRAGALAEDQQLAEAEQMFQRGVDLSLALVREFPEVSIHYQVLATTLRDWGKYALSGDKPEQMERFQRTVQELESRALKGIQGANLAVVLVGSYRTLAQSQTGQEKLQTIRKGIAACHQATDATRALRESAATASQSKAILAQLDIPMGSMAEMLGSLHTFPESVEVSKEFIELSEKLAPLRKRGFWCLGHDCRWLGLTQGYEKEYARKSIAAFERYVAEDPSRVDSLPFLADTWQGLGTRLNAPEELSEAESCFRKAKGAYNSILAHSPNDRSARDGVARTDANLIKVLRARNKHAEAEEILGNFEEKPADDVQTRIRRGTFYRELGELDKAITDFSWVIANDLKQNEIWDLLGNCHLRKGELTKARDDYSEAIKLRPSTAWYWHERAFIHLVLEEHEKSVADHSRSIELGDLDAEQRMRRGHSYRALGDLDKAEADYSRAIELNPADWDNWYRRGEIWAERGQTDKAQADFAKAIQNKPDCELQVGIRHNDLAHARWAKGRLEEAEQEFRHALALKQKVVDAFPANPDYRFHLGHTHLGLAAFLRATNRPQEATDYYRQALAVFKKLAAESADNRDYRDLATRCYHHVLELLLEQNKLADAEALIRDAIDEFKQLITAQPARPGYWRSRADFERQLAQLQASGKRPLEADKSYQEAIDSYQKLFADFPKYDDDLWPVYSGFAQALAATNRLDQADEARRKAVKHAPQDAGTLNELAWRYATNVELRARDAGLAVALAKKGIKADPTNEQLPNTLGVASYRAGNWQDAIEWLTKSMECRNGGDSFDWFFLAMSHWRLGDKVEARKWQAKAVEWMEAKATTNQELLRFRAELEELMNKEVADRSAG